MKKLLSALFVLALCSSVAMATVPDPSNCEVTPDLNNGVLICPDNPVLLNGTTYTITVRNASNNPIPNAAVVFELGAEIAVCTTFVDNATTDANGVATIILRGAGCIHNQANAAVVKANGIVIKTFNYVKSPANGGTTTNAPLESVDTSALVAFADTFNDVVPSGTCHDYDNSGNCDTGDLPFFGDAFSNANSCDLIGLP
jgi:hypothetical protein